MDDYSLVHNVDASGCITMYRGVSYKYHTNYFCCKLVAVLSDASAFLEYCFYAWFAACALTVQESAVGFLHYRLVAWRAVYVVAVRGPHIFIVRSIYCHLCNLYFLCSGVLIAFSDYTLFAWVVIYSLAVHWSLVAS